MEVVDHNTYPYEAW